MKASARKRFPEKQARKVKESDARKRTDKADDGETTSTESNDGEGPNSMVKVDGEAVVGEGAIGALQGIQSRKSTIHSSPNGKRHRKRVPKNHPFDASLVLNANPPYALGETLLDSIHLYQMGKKDETGAYIILEEIKLFD